MDGETIRFIREEIERQMNVLLTGKSSAATQSTEDIQSMYPGMAAITKAPVASPFGLSSAAPDGIPVLAGKQGAHFGNRSVLGHFDPNRPPAAKGETVLYDQFGNKMELRQSGMTQTSPKGFAAVNTGKMSLTSNEKELFEILNRLLKTIINARTNTILGAQPLIPNPTGIPQKETFIDIQADLATMKGGS